MPWNNGGPSPWGSPGGSSGGSSGGGGDRPPPGGPWGGGNDGDRPGGGRRPGGPFGGSGGGGPLPDLDGLIAQLQGFVRGIMGGGGGRMSGGRGLGLLALGVVALWGASGFYRVQPDEQGVVLRFGAYVYWTPPGLHWHLPWPIERVERPAVTRINRTEIGYRSLQGARDQGTRDVPVESLMLTGDENIIDIDFAVFWRINNAAAFLFNTRNPELLVRGVAESSMREVIGRTPIQPALAQARAQIEQDVLRQTQQILDRYTAGVEITQVQLQKVDPPAAVIESFRDVQRANTDAERLRNEAESYRNDIVPRARGDAARITAEAEGAKQASIAQATGQSQRFDSVLTAYQKAKDVTVRRMYLDTMQSLLSHTQTLVVDDRMKGLVPFLPLSPPNTPTVRPPTRPATPPSSSTSSATSGQQTGGNR
ncbi:MAG: FtsH protease activity modulator HflK [Acetobacteraceae bacterium]